MDTLWAAVLESLIRKSVKCCKIFNELDDSEDELLNSALTRDRALPRRVTVRATVSDYETNVYYFEDDHLD